MTSVLMSAASGMSRRALVGGAALTLWRMSADVASAAEQNPLGALPFQVGGRLVYGKEDLMKQKSHGTTEKPVQQQLRWGVDRDTVRSSTCSSSLHANVFFAVFLQPFW